MFSKALHKNLVRKNKIKPLFFSKAIAVVTLSIFLNTASALTAQANATPFATWLEEFKQEALAEGISDKTLEKSLKDIKPLERIIELDRRQPEFTLTLDEYLNRVVNQQRINTAKVKLVEHQQLLREVSAKYNVQPRFIVALWAIETDFGRLTGGFKVIEALATLAYDGRRAEYFRKELLNALRIVEEGHIHPNRFTGSWAGAMGQSQFMPSSFLNYAVDYNNDGKKDIWHSLPDVFASIANYLQAHGWENNRTWGREVKLPANFDASLASLETQKPLTEWQKLGVRSKDGSALPTVEINASLIIPSTGQGRAFLVYENFRTILKWNRSNLFAFAVGTLADKMVE